MSHTSLTVYGAPWCSDCKRAKKFLGEQRVHYEWVDVEQLYQAAKVYTSIVYRILG